MNKMSISKNNSAEILHQIDEQISLLDKEINKLSKQKRLLILKKQKLIQDENDSENFNCCENIDWENKAFPWTEKLFALLRDRFKLTTFRSLQLSVINATLSNEDCLVILPTGGGKSLCYQLPSLYTQGVTIVVSPLISLMDDQCHQLKQLNISIHMLSSTTDKTIIKEIHTNLKTCGNLGLLYVTPERLAKSKTLMNCLEKLNDNGKLDRIVVDEVHCCSQWGHDFRLDYKFLSIFKHQFPKVAILGLTATATQDVLDDVKKILNIPKALVFRAPLNRPNLFYEVHKRPSSLQESVIYIHKLVQDRFSNKSGIIYCLTQKDCDEMTLSLKSLGLKVGCYHANMDSDQRTNVHNKWLENNIQIVIATIAFGMGIDKSDVSFVVHQSLSKSLENYYQESGRAGRDGAKAYCILLVSYGDVFRQSTMVFTQQTGLEKLYIMVDYAYNNQQKCRRMILSNHFNDASLLQCQQMCDNCFNKYDKLPDDDMSQPQKYLPILEQIIKKSSALDKRLTGGKLLELFTQQCKHKKGQGEHLDDVIINLLMCGHLKEEFHFTPYSTISYLVLGNAHEVSSREIKRKSVLTSEAGNSKISKTHI